MSLAGQALPCCSMEYCISCSVMWDFAVKFDSFFTVLADFKIGRIASLLVENDSNAVSYRAIGGNSFRYNYSIGEFEQRKKLEII